MWMREHDLHEVLCTEPGGKFMHNVVIVNQSCTGKARLSQCTILQIGPVC
jgi:hypothetical protein